jgi:hypothetical protein
MIPNNIRIRTQCLSQTLHLQFYVLSCTRKQLLIPSNHITGRPPLKVVTQRSGGSPPLFCPTIFFGASLHTRTTFCTSQSRPHDPHSSGSCAYSVVDLYKKVQGFFFVISFSWLTYVSWWRHAQSYGFPQDECEWSVGRPILGNCWTSSGVMNCYATTLWTD